MDRGERDTDLAKWADGLPPKGFGEDILHRGRDLVLVVGQQIIGFGIVPTNGVKIVTWQGTALRNALSPRKGGGLWRPQGSQAHNNQGVREEAGAKEGTGRRVPWRAHGRARRTRGCKVGLVQRGRQENSNRSR